MISSFLKILTFAFLVLFFCEFLIYYIVLFQCSWPTVSEVNSSEASLKVIFLADTHLLGPRKGHWFDKLRREWQMHRAFQSAMFLLQPNAVFILGDLFDEGQWSNDLQFSTYMTRFSRLFRTPDEVSLYVVPGNHDIGFHYTVTPRLVHQFHKAFNLSSVQHLSIRNIPFILVNSMAFEGDYCDLCADAENRLLTVSEKLDCVPGGECRSGRPILLQHFPMYRASDSICNELDEAPSDEKNNAFREKWDCLSKAASEKMLDMLHPLAIFTGHTHHGCHVIHREDIHEYTVPSFSWRNKNNPTFNMAVIGRNKLSVNKCFMPEEDTVISTYFLSSALVVACIIIKLVKKRIHGPFDKWKLI